jgi:hypothetical protein
MEDSKLGANKNKKIFISPKNSSLKNSPEKSKKEIREKESNCDDLKIEKKVLGFLQNVKEKRASNILNQNFKNDLKNWFPYLNTNSKLHINFNIYITKESGQQKEDFIDLSNPQKIKKEPSDIFYTKMVNYEEKTKLGKIKNNNFEIFLPKAKRLTKTNDFEEKEMPKKVTEVFPIKKVFKKRDNFTNFNIDFNEVISDDYILKDDFVFQINKLQNYWQKKDFKTPFVFKRQNLMNDEFYSICEVIDLSQKLA